MDSPDTPDQSAITNVLYTSIPSYTFSDHKPIVSLLLLPAPQPRPVIPLLQLPYGFHPRPDPLAMLKRYAGRTLDRIVGYCWWFLVVIGAGSAAFGVGNFLLGLGAWTWWRGRPAPSQGAPNHV